MDFSGCPADIVFGPAVEGCRNDFDFTIKFERIFFSLVPAATFIAICPARIIFLLEKRSFVGGTWLQLSKQVSKLPFFPRF